MERRYGRADRIWVVDRGMVSAENIKFLKQNGRRYIVGTPKSMLKQFERELLTETWHTVREGLEVKLCSAPDGQETFVLCRSGDRREKEKAMHERFESGSRRDCDGSKLDARSNVAIRWSWRKAGTIIRPEQSRRRIVSDRGTNGRRWPGAPGMEEGGEVAGVGRVERRLLLAAK